MVLTSLLGPGPTHGQTGMEHVADGLLSSSILGPLRPKAIVDAITVLLLNLLLFWLLYGGISSTQYALQYNETSYFRLSAAQLAPIKIRMLVGCTMMPRFRLGHAVVATLPQAGGSAGNELQRIISAMMFSQHDAAV